MRLDECGPWIVPIRPESAATQITIIAAPFAGGSAHASRGWDLHLDSATALYAIELPGRGTRIGEDHIDSMDVLVDQLANAICPAVHQQCVFFGHSLGAAIAFELVRKLESDNRSFHTILSGQQAFHRTSNRPPIRHLDDEAFLDEVIRFGGTTFELLTSTELQAMFLPILRSDIALGETYRPSLDARIRGDISAYGGIADAEVSIDDVKAWSKYTRGRFRHRMFPGNHFYLQQHEALFVETLLNDIHQNVACDEESK